MKEFDINEINKKVAMECMKSKFKITPEGNLTFEAVVESILEAKNKKAAEEFTKCIAKMLSQNGVKVMMTEYEYMGGYGVAFEGLDFTAHDKVFEDKIAELERQLADIQKYTNGDDLYSKEVKTLISEGGIGRMIRQYKNISRRLDEISTENKELKQRIAELESEETCVKEPISDDCRPSIEWYENRYQSDCIEINRLNTTIDVLIHKVEYLKQFAGLE